jgi:hypothetical protein
VEKDKSRSIRSHFPDSVLDTLIIKLGWLLLRFPIRFVLWGEDTLHVVMGGPTLVIGILYSPIQNYWRSLGESFQFYTRTFFAPPFESTVTQCANRFGHRFGLLSRHLLLSYAKFRSAWVIAVLYTIANQDHATLLISGDTYIPSARRSGLESTARPLLYMF